MFTKQRSLILKGVAILMMLFHHCFLSGRFDGYAIGFWPFTELSITHMASVFKICVSLFAFISGYGLLRSYGECMCETGANSDETSTEGGRWVIRRVIKTLNAYWFVLILSWIVCMAIDGMPLRTYSFDTSSTLFGCWNMLMDFLGLTNLLGRTPLNGTWWYMSAAIAYVMLVPLLYRSLQTLGSVGTLCAVFLLPRMFQVDVGSGIHFVLFLLSFSFGMVFARENLFEKWHAFWNKQTAWVRVLKFVCMTLILFLTYKVFYRLPTDQFWDIKWNIMPLIVIMYVNDYVAHIPGVRQILTFLGKHATNIFLTHTFIREYYAKDFIYGMKHFVLIVAVLLGLSLIISFAIEGLKKLVRYEKWMDRLLSPKKKQQA